MQCIEGPSASEEAGCSIVHHNHACGRGTQRYRNAAGSPFSLRHACTTFACLLTPLLTHARKKMHPVVFDRAKPHCDRLREPSPRAALCAPPHDTPPAPHSPSPSSAWSAIPPIPRHTPHIRTPSRRQSMQGTTARAKRSPPHHSAARKYTGIVLYSTVRRYVCVTLLATCELHFHDVRNVIFAFSNGPR